MPQAQHVAEPQLERQGQRLIRPAGPFLALTISLMVIGIVLLIATSGWAWALGLVLLVLSGPPAVVGLALLAVGAVSRWTARHKPFA
jgi:hypothetical protein